MDNDNYRQQRQMVNIVQSAGWEIANLGVSKWGKRSLKFVFRTLWQGQRYNQRWGLRGFRENSHAEVSKN